MDNNLYARHRNDNKEIIKKSSVSRLRGIDRRIGRNEESMRCDRRKRKGRKKEDRQPDYGSKESA